MQFLLILALIALVALKMLGKVNVSWLVVGLLAAAAFFLPILTKIKDSILDIGTGFSDGDDKNACGCRTAQKTLVRHKPFLKKAQILRMDCASALSFTQRKPGRAQIVGCA